MGSRPRLSLVKKIAFSLVFPITILVGIEVAARLRPDWFDTTSEEITRARQVAVDGVSPFFAPHPHTVFRLREKDWVNEDGFVGESFRVEKRPGVLRIACLGASTTQGGNNDGIQGSYPYQLEEILRERGVEAEVFNFGVSNWTTAESLVNYVLLVQDFAPDVVIVHHAINDTDPRAYPGFRADYRHYRVPFHPPELPWADRLLLSISDAYVAARLEDLRQIDIMALTTTKLPPGTIFKSMTDEPEVTTRPFRRNLETIARLVNAHGGHIAFMTMPCSEELAPAHWKHIVFGARQNNEVVRELCAENGYALIDAERLVEERPELDRHFRDLVHLTSAGNRLKAELIARRLSQLGWLKR